LPEQAKASAIVTIARTDRRRMRVRAWPGRAVLIGVADQSS
jgi:hypothetical protein